MPKEQTQYIVPCAAIVKDNKLLLGFKHSSSSRHCLNKWEIPGGRAKFGQSYEEALKSKMKQYLGVGIKIEEILGFVHSVVSSSVDGKAIYHFYFIPARCRLLSERFKIDKSKLREVRWFSLKEVEDLHKKGELVDEGDLKIAKMVLKK